MLPVYRGELQGRSLGCAVEAWDEDGNSVVDEVGELVITEPMPSMPLFFWGDDDGSRYRASYFEMYPGVWRHGDWIEITSRGTAIIYGRSDSTINRSGIRMGTSEIYRAVASVDEVTDALVVDVPRPGTEGWMPLFVVLREGAELDDELTAEIERRIREQCSPRHVPDEVFEIAEVPRTLCGKVLEVPVKRILTGHPGRAGRLPRLARQPGGARLLRRARGAARSGGVSRLLGQLAELGELQWRALGQGDLDPVAAGVLGGVEGAVGDGEQVDVRASARLVDRDPAAHREWRRGVRELRLNRDPDALGERDRRPPRRSPGRRSRTPRPRAAPRSRWPG